MKKKMKSKVFAALATTAIVGSLLAAYFIVNRPASSIPPGGSAADFDLVVMDGSRQVEIDAQDVTCTLWGLPIGEDATDWSAWDQIAGVTDVADISANDLDTDIHSRFVLNYTAKSVDVGDDTDGDDDQNVNYLHRQAEIFTNMLNTVFLYEQPSNGAGIIAFNTETFAFTPVNATYTVCGDVAGVDAAKAYTNVTTFIMLNSSQVHAKYVSYWNFVTNEMADVEITWTANKTVVAGDWLCKSGLVKTKPAATTICFNSDYLDKYGAMHKYEWGTTPTVDACFNAVALTFNKITI